ncbi:discoidin domain-containing protein [Vibrio penaeicida]|uniref:galactose-binding domain-containing protein n=1 Tax=Vibrio penaeicida TaxID=104609 RepID=UPI002734D267|nr:discoidin domain-containing protein [Vibrio penaeicida]MDP2572094.1 discoidin domain-containing protein [Vibrio penaeicida]
MKLNYLPLLLSALVSQNILAAEPEDVLPVPSERQLSYLDNEMNAFFHFSLNGYYNREWGNGTEDPEIFNPHQFNADEWVQAAKDMGAKNIILVAKHHSGFHLFDSPYSDYDVANTPWGRTQAPPRDMMKEVRDAAIDNGIKFSVYLSPWDRHHPNYVVYRDDYSSEDDYDQAMKIYDDFFSNSLQYVLDNYGPIHEMWFDGAGTGPQFGRTGLDFERFIQTIRNTSPETNIAIVGPDIRWVGNEHGTAPENAWSIHPLSDRDDRYNETGVVLDGRFRGMSSSERLNFYPNECDTPILEDDHGHIKWFWWDSHRVRSQDTLFNTVYFDCVGHNSSLLLNLSPDTEGKIPQNQSVAAKALGDSIRMTFSNNLLSGASVSASSIHESTYNPSKVLDGNKNTYWAAQDKSGWHHTPSVSIQEESLTFTMDTPISFDVFSISEPIFKGQRITHFSVQSRLNEGEWKTIVDKGLIGTKRLVKLPSQVIADELKVVIDGSRDVPLISEVGVYKHEQSKVDVTFSPSETLQPQPFEVTLTSPIDNDTIYYTTDGSEPTYNSPVYTTPISISQPTTIKILSRSAGIKSSKQYFLGTAKNLAIDSRAVVYQSSVHASGAGPERAVDGNVSGHWGHRSVTHTGEAAGDAQDPWWEIDLGREVFVSNIVLHNRTDCCSERLDNVTVLAHFEPLNSKVPLQVKNHQGVFVGNTGENVGSSVSIPVNRQSRFIRVQAEGSDRYLSLAEVQIMGIESSDIVHNVAKNMYTVQSSNLGGEDTSNKAVDGNTNGNFRNGSVSHTSENGSVGDTWWRVDLGESKPISQIRIFNRTDCCSDRLANFDVLVSNNPNIGSNVAWSHYQGQPVGDSLNLNLNNVQGRYVTLKKRDNTILSLAEVEVMSTERSLGLNVSTFKQASQSSEHSSGAAASRAVDGIDSGIWGHGSVSHTGDNDTNAWWQVDLGDKRTIGLVKLLNRTDCCGDRLENLRVHISDSSFGNATNEDIMARDDVVTVNYSGPTKAEMDIVAGYSGRYLRISRDGVTEPLHIAEVVVIEPIVGD